MLKKKTKKGLTDQQDNPADSPEKATGKMDNESAKDENQRKILIHYNKRGDKRCYRQTTASTSLHESRLEWMQQDTDGGMPFQARRVG